jgi:molybdopterin-guanine dinucleotide biosynthesis protein
LKPSLLLDDLLGTDLARPPVASSPAASRPAPLLANVKQSFVTRRATLRDAAGLATDRPPRAGDLALARVERLGHHTRLQLAGGRRSQLHVGDRIVVCYGHRYAPDQYEAEVPCGLEPCALVTAGGVAGRVVSRHPRMKPATTIRPEGLLCDARGVVLNLRRYALPIAHPSLPSQVPVVAVLGTSMNAGKTTTAAALVRGLTGAGLRVSAVKATGTGSGNDVWSLEDAGAHLVLDFADMGYPSTFRVPPSELETLLDRLLASAARITPDVIVLEVADGLLHEETAGIVCSNRFRSAVTSILFCAGDGLGALAGTEWLEARGLPVVGVSGLVTASPLAREEARRATRLPLWTRDALADPEQALGLAGLRP